MVVRWYMRVALMLDIAAARAAAAHRGMQIPRAEGEEGYELVLGTSRRDRLPVPVEKLVQFVLYHARDPRTKLSTA